MARSMADLFDAIRASSDHHPDELRRFLDATGFVDVGLIQESEFSLHVYARTPET